MFWKLATLVLVVALALDTWWLWPPGEHSDDATMSFYTGGPDGGSLHHDEVWRLEPVPQPDFSAHPWAPDMRIRFQHTVDGLQMLVSGTGLQWPSSIALEENSDPEFDYFAQEIDIAGHTHNLDTWQVTNPQGQTLISLRLTDVPPLEEPDGAEDDEHGGDVHIGP